MEEEAFYRNNGLGPLEIAAAKIFTKETVVERGRPEGGDEEESAIIIVSVYVAPNPQVERLKVAHLDEMINTIRRTYPNTAICVLGDLNAGTHSRSRSLQVGDNTRMLGPVKVFFF